MPELQPSPVSADRNLLFGILALQMDFVSRDQLVAAMNAWVLDKTRALGDLLREQGALSNEEFVVLESLVQAHLQRHSDDPEKSLQAVTSLGAPEDLRQITDPDVQASLARACSSNTDDLDPYATLNSLAGIATAAGARFRILRPHARGGLGEVFVARDEELCREVALKEMQQQHAANPSTRARFVLEAAITGGLEHPGIVPVYALGTHRDGRPFYAMRFIRGDSLKAAIERLHKPAKGKRDPAERAVTLRQLLRRIYDVCNAMEYAHSRGVVHRDLKPANIMLGKYGETLIVDWGLAKAMGRPESQPATETLLDELPLQPEPGSGATPTQMGSALGTPAYMAPEQAAGRLDKLGPTSDVYSLGATLYCLLTGKPPFAGDSHTVIAKVQAGDFLTPREVQPSVPRALEAICLKAMALEPGERYPSAAELGREIERWLDDQPVQAWPEPWHLRARRWARRNIALTMWAAGLLVASLAGLVLAYFLPWYEQWRSASALAKAANYYQSTIAEVERWTDLIDTTLASRQETRGSRAKFLRETAAIYDDLLKEKRDDVIMRPWVASASLRVGALRVALDQPAWAEKAYQDAIALYEPLARESPRAEYRRGLAQGHFGLGDLAAAAGRLPQAEEAYRRGVALYEQLAKDYPAVPDYRVGLALGLSNLAAPLSTTARKGEAEKAHRQAQTLFARLAEEYPKEPAYRRLVAYSHNSLGQVLQSARRDLEARQAYALGLAAYEQLVKDYPGVAQYRSELARTYHNLGVRLAFTARPDEARQAYRQAVTQYERLLGEFPKESTYRRDLANTHYLLARLLPSAEAEQSYRRALSLYEQSAQDFAGLPDYRRDLADLCNSLAWLLSNRPEAQLRDTADAVALAERAVATLPEGGEYWVTLGMSQYRAGHYAEAREALTKALQIRPQDLPARFCLAMAHCQLRDLNAAQTEYADASRRLRTVRPPVANVVTRFHTEATNLLRLGGAAPPPKGPGN